MNIRCNNKTIPVASPLRCLPVLSSDTPVGLFLLGVFTHRSVSTPPMQQQQQPVRRRRRAATGTNRRDSFRVGGWGKRFSKAGSEDHPRVSERLPGEYKLDFLLLSPPFWRIIFWSLVPPLQHLQKAHAANLQWISPSRQNHLKEQSSMAKSVCRRWNTEHWTKVCQKVEDLSKRALLLKRIPFLQRP